MLQEQIEWLFDEPPKSYTDEHFELFQKFKEGLNAGDIRAAEPDAASPSGWRVNGWVKKGILLGFRMGAVVDMSGTGASSDAAAQRFFDKATYPLKTLSLANAVRIVPGGSSIRDGCFLGKGVTCMPPMFINVGAYVGDQTMVDSHALVGSCAQVGKQLPHLRRRADWRRARAGRSPARDHRGRSDCRRKLRRLRRHRRKARGRSGHRNDPESLHARLRSGARRDLQRERRSASDHSRKGCGRGGLAPSIARAWQEWGFLFTRR